MKVYYKRITVSVKTALMCLCIYGIYVLFLRRQESNLINMLIILFSCFFLSYAFIDISAKGLLLSNLFLITYFSVLALNNLNISNLQKSKNFVDLYYYFTGGLVFFAMLRIGERLPRVHICLKQAVFSPNFVAVAVILLLLVGKISIFRHTGIRIFTNQWFSGQSKNFAVANLSGLTAMCLWVSLMFFPNVTIILKLIIVIMAFMFQAFDISRGGIVRISLYLVLLWVANCGKQFMTRKNLVRVAMILLIIFLLFSILGNYRQIKRGWTEKNTIGDSMQSIIGVDMINWIYSYTATNFDVLKQEYIEKDKTGDFKAILLPVIRLVYGSAAASEYESSVFTNGINGMNAGTFLARFVRESGMLFVFSVGILGIVVALLDWLCRIINFSGGHYFLLMLTALTIFGNYYLEPSFFFSLIGGIILYFFSCSGRATKRVTFLRMTEKGNA